MSLSVGLSICLSDTCQCSTQMAQRSVTETTVTLARDYFSDAKDLGKIQIGIDLQRVQQMDIG